MAKDSNNASYSVHDPGGFTGAKIMPAEAIARAIMAVRRLSRRAVVDKSCCVRSWEICTRI